MKFYGQFSPPVDQVIFERYQKRIEDGLGYFMECGAYDGITESNCMFLEETFGWSGINVEPFPHHFEKLKGNRPKSKNFNYALSSQSGEREFMHVVHPRLGDDFGNGSLSHTEEHRRQLEEAGCEFQTITVPTRTYDDVVREAGFPRIDFFSLDVEGHELEVLAGMKDARLLPRILCVETGHDESGAIARKVKSMGYRRDEEYLVNTFFVRRSWLSRCFSGFRKAA